MTLVAVTKGVDVPFIREALDAGAAHIGENRIQEAQGKFGVLNEYAKTLNRRLTWHLIGHLQTNKVKDAVVLFDCIHSVDSVRVASAIDAQAAKIGKVQDVLVEVNVSAEKTKFGFQPAQVASAVGEMAALKNIRVMGLMTIAPETDDPEGARPYFRRLRELMDECNELRIISHELRVLSMGMTGDFRVAVEEGATIVRIGRGIFEGEIVTRQKIKSRDEGRRKMEES